MAGYNETFLQGLQRLNAMEQGRRRLAETERYHQGQQTLRDQQVQNLERQRMQQNMLLMQGNQRANEIFANTVRHQLEGERQARAEAVRREAADRERARDAQRGKLKPGYRWAGPDLTDQEMIQGGPAWREQSSKHATDLGTLAQLHEMANSAGATIDRILDPKVRASGFNPNFGGYNALVTEHMPQWVPGFGKTQDTRMNLENLKSQLKTYGLNLLRGTSGAIGSITEREWPILEKQIEALSPLMSEEAAADALGRIKNRLVGMKERTMNVYKQEWGDSPFFQKEPLASQKPGGAGTVPQGIDPRDWKYMTPEERSLWQNPQPQQ